MKSFLRFSLLLGVFILMVISCKKDPEVVSGCIDPLGDNFNATATVGDNSCTYQKRFVGTYSGNIECKGLLSAVFDSADIIVTELIDKSKVNVVIQTSIGPIPVTGNVTRDSLSVSTVLRNLKIVPNTLFPGTGSTEIGFDIGVEAKSMKISADNKTLKGDIRIILTPLESILIGGVPIFPANTPYPDDCAYEGKKQ